MDKREFVVQSVVDGKVTGQLKTEKLGIAYDLQSQMVNGIGVDAANGALIAKSAYVEIIEANYRSRVKIVVPQLAKLMAQVRRAEKEHNNRRM